MQERCNVCGSVVDNIAEICPVCGAQLSTGQAIPPQQSMAGGQAVPPQQPMAGGQAVSPQQPMMGRPVYSTGEFNGGNPVIQQPVPAKKKKIFSILAIVFAGVAVLSACCVWWLGLLLAIAAIVFGILALVKKQIKAPAIIGLVLGGIAMVGSGFVGLVEVALHVQYGTGTLGLFRQLTDAQIASIPDLSDTMIYDVDGGGYIILGQNGACVLNDEKGTYTSYNYMDSVDDDADQNDMLYATAYAIENGYEVKDLICLKITANGSTERIYLIIPDDYQTGDTIYEVTGTSLDNYELKAVLTVRAETTYE